jgi:hypothetical protein
VLFILVSVIAVFSAILFTNSLSVVQQVARVKQVSGTVALRPAGAEAFKAITQERNVRVGSLLQTGKDGRATLWWPDGTSLRVDPGSELTIERCRFDKRKDSLFSQFSLKAGRVWVHVVRMLSADSKFEISTPTATAGVRGTTFAVEVGQDGATDVFVYEGAVEVTAGKQSLSVKAGQAMAVAGDGQASVRELTPKEKAEGQDAPPEAPAGPPAGG